MLIYSERDLAELQTQATHIAEGLQKAIVNARPSQGRKPGYWDKQAFEIGLELILEQTAEPEVYTYLYAQAIIHARSWFTPEEVSTYKNRAWDAEVALLEGVNYD
jgi:hypothetical protein